MKLFCENGRPICAMSFWWCWSVWWWSACSLVGYAAMIFSRLWRSARTWATNALLEADVASPPAVVQWVLDEETVMAFMLLTKTFMDFMHFTDAGFLSACSKVQCEDAQDMLESRCRAVPRMRCPRW
eukprot:s13_g23.t1